MKKVFYLLIGTLFALITVSCSVKDDYNSYPPGPAPVDPDYSYLLQNYDLWEVDHSLTTGPANTSVPFLDRAITLSFYNGMLYANNNFSGFGVTGNGYGVDVGIYKLGYNTVTIDHDVYGRYVLEIYYVAPDEIRLYDRLQDLTYTLYGHYKSKYNYNYVFFNNIQYFLQEFNGWRKIATYDGRPTVFDDENFLRFNISGNIFESSKSNANLPLNFVKWNYIGNYNVSNTSNFDRKLLQLNYGPQGNEIFELIYIDDATIDLYHLASKTTYRFKGEGYIQFLRPQFKAYKQAVEK